MKKRFLIPAIIVALTLVVCSINYNWLYYRVYPFDRITGEYEITVNGKSPRLAEEYYEYADDGKIRLQNDTEDFSIKGGEYGRYTIGFVIDDKELFELTGDERFKETKDLELSVVYHNLNWWHISELDIEIDVACENGEWYVYYNIDLEEPGEDFRGRKSNTRKKISIDEIENTEISIGM